jgi:hypothetical protein
VKIDIHVYNSISGQNSLRCTDGEMESLLS